MADDSSPSGADIRKRFQASDSDTTGQSAAAPPAADSGAAIRQQFRAADEAVAKDQPPPAAQPPLTAFDSATSGEQTAPAWMMQPTSVQDLRSRIQQADLSAQEALKPSPDDNLLTTIGKGAGSLGVHLVGNLAQVPLAIAQGISEGTGGVQIDPNTNALSLTPEAQAAGSLAATPLRFSGANPLQYVAPGTLDRPAPLSPEFRAAPMTPEASAAAAAPSGGPTSPTGVPTVTVTARAPPAAAPPSGGPRAGAVPQTTNPPTTPAEALPVATGLLEKARSSGASLQPDYVNKFIDKVSADAEPAGPGTAAVAGPSDPVAAMVQRLQALRDKPLDIKDVMGMDQELNARQRAAIKTDPDLARRLGNLQDSLRDQVDAATQADVGGGAEGWQAFKDGRAAYSQYKKMQAVEDMKERADGTQNPTTSYKTAVNNFTNSPKSRGWTDEEKASLKDSADRGVIGGTLHMLGSRLVPYVAGGAGLAGEGPVSAVASMVAAHYMGERVRNVGNALQARRVGRTLELLGSGIPNPYPLVPPAAP